MNYNNEERIGVYSIAKIFVEELGWIFREQPINDFGIDGFVEITTLSLDFKDILPTGKLFGVQIKSGKSYFSENSEDSIIFRGTIKHLNYWLNHSIPVVIIIYDKDIGVAYWREVTTSTAILTKKNFKIEIPKKNILDEKSIEKFKELAYFKSMYEYKLWQLCTSVDEIKLLLKKELYLYVEIDYLHYFHDFNITLLLSDEDCNHYQEIIYRYDDTNPNRFQYMFLFSKNNSLEEAIKDTIPWADLLLNGHTFNDKLLTETIFEEISSYNQSEFYPDILRLKEQNDFLGLSLYLSDQYTFRLTLKPNILGSAFLEIDDFLNKEPIVKQRIFF